MISPVDTLILATAGALTGVVGSAGGITSLVSYPVLLAIGLHPLPATVVNNVALVACWPGSALASRPELRGRAPWLRRLLPAAALGGAVGAGLLLTTSPKAFERIVPFLVAAGSLALLAEPRLTAWRRRRGGGSSVGLAAGVTSLSAYNGYFGAGAGVLTLTLVLFTTGHDLPTANALKNMLIGAGSIAAAIVLVIAAPEVRWDATVPLALGMLAGSALGPRVVRVLPERLLRWTIAALGLLLAIRLAISAIS